MQQRVVLKKANRIQKILQTLRMAQINRRVANQVTPNQIRPDRNMKENMQQRVVLKKVNLMQKNRLTRRVEPIKW